jgi:hypothetical protein
VPAAGHSEFTFSLALSHEPRFDSMLADLATAVLCHVGYDAGEVRELIGVLQDAMARALASGGRACEVAFQAHEGELHLALTFDAAAEWRTSRPLP